MARPSRALVLVALVLYGCSAFTIPDDVRAARDATVDLLVEHRFAWEAASAGNPIPGINDSVAHRAFSADIAEIGRDVEATALELCDKPLAIAADRLQAWAQAYDGWYETDPEENARQLRRLSTDLINLIDTLPTADHEFPLTRNNSGEVCSA